ncbi:Aryl-alcohol dehydrogenase [Colletotrichum gloeosporioides]|uniref:Aryl-alcohol dehydrogenase n=1 Tax=Colletotrichum gloeosporioides TaxID=474922 RepID=A0A8H4FRT0_COLGL|nr:Aryl-alcohol dehydrogenase [Colletotrichum gloeosporioides]KAF3812120.1 Aryl-alcohol dehydrogenase [Colletotrichum gloeosporioides]
MASAYATTQAIVAYPPEKGKRQWRLEDVELTRPEDEEAVVEVIATGICHTDLGCASAPDGTPGFPVPPYPRIVGAGYVKSVGNKVSKVKPGDAVLLSFAFCTQCHNCKFGAPGYCESFNEINFTGCSTSFSNSGTGRISIGGSFFGQSSFSRLARVKQTSIVNVTRLVNSKDELKMLAPLGCGIQTGAGTITKLAAAKPDDAVAVIGLGGVGLAAVMAAKIIGCRTVIGIDRVPSRLDLAQSLGATHTVNTANITNTLTEEIWKLTSGPGSTITVDATGVVPLIKQGLEFTAKQGKMILLGVAPMDATLDLPLVPHMVSGKQLLGSMEGGVHPEDYIPQLIQWYHEGRFPLEKLIKTYDVKDFELAVKDMEDGTTIKPILIWS